ncbi:MAG: hypothetical protein ACOYOA_02990 [Saprospiraceae bacterium]
MSIKILRIVFLLFGLVFAYLCGVDTVKPIWYRMSGEMVEGRVKAFVSGKYMTVEQEQNRSARKRKPKIKRPVYRYPIAEGSRDSLSASNGNGVLFFVFQYDLNDKVNVVFPSSNPADAYIFSFMNILASLLFTIFSLYLVWFAVYRLKV